MKDNVLIGEMFSDLELQWFRGGVQVVDVVNVVTEENIVDDAPTSRSDDYFNGADVGFFDDSPDVYVHVPYVGDDPTYDDIPF